MKKFVLVLLSFIFLLGCATTPNYLVHTKEWSTPGLVNSDGSKYKSPEANKTIGVRINVLDFGATPNNPDFDNTQSFEKAIKSAKVGDEVYVPAGNYYFSGNSHFDKNYMSHIALKSGVNFIGEDKNTTTLISNFPDDKNEKYNTAIILALSQSNIVVSGFTLTSVTPDSNLPDPDVSNYNHYADSAPLYGVVVDNRNPIKINGNILIENLLVEKFDRTGVRIRAVRDVRVKNTTIQKATDLGAGGAGYGISIQGIGPGSDVTGTNLDTLYNIVENCNLVGPYLRHGIIIQYYAHNNLITNNIISDTLLDSIDLHGEDEYSNEISYNTIKNTRNGAGIGIGNSGATHDASGTNNYIYQNKILGSKRGIDVLYGSQNSIIVSNILDGILDTGIYLRDGNGTIIQDNTISNTTNSDGYGIKIDYSYNALNPDSGIPDGITIKNNSFLNITNGVFIQTHTDNYIYANNMYKDVKGSEYIDNTSEFIVPEITDVVVPKNGQIIYPIDDNFITSESKKQVQSQNNMKLKASTFELPYNRMVYMKFDLSELDYNGQNVYLKFAAKSKDGLATLAIHGSTDYVDWTEDNITWENSRYHHPDLAVTENDGTLTHITDFTFPVVSNEFSTYYVDITSFIKDVKVNYITIIISNDLLESMYCEVYTKEISNLDFKPSLIVE